MAQTVRQGDLVTLQFHVHDLSGRMVSDCFVETFVVGQGQVRRSRFFGQSDKLKLTG